MSLGKKTSLVLAEGRNEQWTSSPRPSPCLGKEREWKLALRRPIALASLVISCLIIVTGCSKKEQVPELPQANLDASMTALIQSARGAVAASPQSADVWGKLGQAFHSAEFFSQAETCYAKAAELDPRAPKWPHLLGLLQMQDQPHAAISNLNRAVSLSSGQMDISRLYLGRALLEQGRLGEAETQLQDILRLNPNHAAARLEMGRIQLTRGQLEPAAELVQPCLTNYFTARSAHILLSQVRLRQGNQQEASVLSRQASQMPKPFDWPDPYLREVQSLRADRQKLQDQANAALMRQRFAEAENILNQLFKAYPDDPEGLLLLGRLRFQQRRCGDSEQALRRYLQAQPDSLNGLMQLSLALLCQQRWDAAIKVLEKATALKPDFGQAWYNLGFAYASMENSGAAITNYQQALRCSPGDMQSHVALAEEYMASKRDLEAMRHLNKALELDPNNPAAKRLRAKFQGR